MWIVLIAMSCRDDALDDTSPAAPVVLSSACGEPSAPTSSRALSFDGAVPTNLIILSIDTLRRDRVGRYSGGSDTPFLDERLADSVALDDLQACANWTLPGVFCATTGRTMVEAGMEPINPERLDDPTYFDPELATMASWLRDAGWATSLVTTSKLFSTELPSGNGFEDGVFDADMNAAAVADAARTTLASLQERAAASGSPWYLQVHFRDPHGPYNPPAAYQGDLAGVDLSPYDPRTLDGIRAIFSAMDDLTDAERAEVTANLETLYAGELRYLDTQLAMLWRDWSAAGVLDDTLVVIWSDHGEQFFEHSRFQHGATLHQEEARAIGLFWADNLPAAAFTAPTTHTDIPATILDLYGILPTEALSGVALGATGADRLRVSVARDKDLRPLLGIDRNGHRLLYHWDGDRSYYQTPNDPFEETDRYDASSEDIACLWEQLMPTLEAIDTTEIGAATLPGP